FSREDFVLTSRLLVKIMNQQNPQFSWRSSVHDRLKKSSPDRSRRPTSSLAESKRLKLRILACSHPVPAGEPVPSPIPPLNRKGLHRTASLQAERTSRMSSWQPTTARRTDPRSDDGPSREGAPFLPEMRRTALPQSSPSIRARRKIRC